MKVSRSRFHQEGILMYSTLMMLKKLLGYLILVFIFALLYTVLEIEYQISFHPAEGPVEIKL